MGQVTEPPELTAEERFADLYATVCDAVERAWQHLPAERDEVPVMHTSDYARTVARRVMDEFVAIHDMETRTTDEVHRAEDEFYHRLWYYRTVAGNRTAQDLAVAEPKLKEIEAAYPGLAVDDPFELGVVHGKLSALRWVLGDEWDNYDT